MAWRYRRINTWSNKDLMDWVRNIGLSDKWEDTMCKAIQAMGCTGQDWFALKSGKDLANSFDIKQPMLANRVYREFKNITEEKLKKGGFVPPPQDQQFGWRYRDKPIKKWTNKDLIDWVKSMGLSEKWEDTMCKAIEATECTGQDWFALKSGKDLANSFDIKQPMLADRVYREFKKITEKKLKKVGYVPPPQEDEEKGFELQLWGQSKYWKVRQKVTANTTIRRVKELYKAESGVGTAIEHIVLIAQAKVLHSSKTLGQCGITNDRHLITVKFQAHGGCFVAGTQILLGNMEQVNIEDIVIGDHIMTYNLNTNKLQSFPVKSVLKYLVNILVKITLSNQTQITCTPSHPFYVANKQTFCCVKALQYDNKQYGELCVGDQVMNGKSELITIENIEYEELDVVNDEFVLVRTLEIDGIHNYFANNILVHNKMGQKGVDVEAKTDTTTGDNDYHFYDVSPGMNYGGTCKTYGCKAKGEPVNFAKGFDANGFNPMDDGFMKIAKCPGCKKAFDINTYYLYKCDSKIMFQKNGGNTKTLTYKPRGDNIVVLGKDGNGELVPEAEYAFFKCWVYKAGTLDINSG